MGREKNNPKTYQFIIGLFLFITGVILVITASNNIRYLGIFLILGAIIYISNLLYLYFKEPNPEEFKSQAREEMLKRQLRR
jgi:membrane-bound ClpP family serine protease